MTMSVAAAQSILKPISMATNTSCLVSIPSIFTPSNSLSHTHLSICFKPTKFQQLSCSYSPLSLPSLISSKKKETLVRASTLSTEQDENEGQDEGFNWGGAENEGEGEETPQFVEPSEETRLYVGNLSYDVENEQLAGIFQEAGEVEIVEIIYNRETGQSRGFGFVTMSTIQEAEKAVEMFHRYELNGRMLTVNKSSPRGSRPERTPRTFEAGSRIYVGNLPWSVDDERLEQVFSEHGKVVSARVISDRETGRSRGFGFVVMSSESEMNDAIASLDGESLDGRTIRVNVAEDKPRTPRY